MSQSFTAKKETLSYLFLEIILKVVVFYLKFQLEFFSIIFPKDLVIQKESCFILLLLL